MQVIKSDARIFAATNRDMEQAISSGTFREDLFYRLNVISITLPPLRDRKQDIRELTIHFLKKFGNQTGKLVRDIDPPAMEILKSYHWPGNIRELASAMERVVVLGQGEILMSSDLPQNLMHPQAHLPATGNGNLSQEMARVEQHLITKALRKAEGNKTEAARILGIKRTTLNSKIKKLKLVTAPLSSGRD